MSNSIVNRLKNETFVTLEERLNRINYKKQTTARKSHTCEMCGNEIHKNELMWWYKPRPLYLGMKNGKARKIYYKWAKRCFDCEPKNYEELDLIKARESREGAY